MVHERSENLSQPTPAEQLAEEMPTTTAADNAATNGSAVWPLAHAQTDVVKQPTPLEARAKIISLIAARGREDRYATLLSWWRTAAAHELIYRLYHDIADWEKKSGKRVRWRLGGRGPVFISALCRFVGDLLRARADRNASGRIYHSLGKTKFEGAPVTYDVFIGVLDGLKALGLVGHEKGRARYRRVDFGDWDASVALPGRASRFWATDKLIKLAADYGLREDNVGEHFKPEPPRDPLVLRDHATGRGANRERGPIIRDYERTERTERLAADIRELNEFLARCELTGGEHHGYTRSFNNASWRKGGRLYSVGGGYQQLSEEKRLRMRLNREAVAEIDIKASYLTIYHAKIVRQPLDSSKDPYAGAGLARDVAKLWVLHSFGKSKPQMRWPPEAIKDYVKDTGKDLRKITKAKDVAEKMLAAFPALQQLKDHHDIWADLQFIESEAVIGTMLILMRTYDVPSLAMHDGILVPRSRVELAKKVLTERFRKVVGIEPMLTVEMAEQSDYVDVLRL
jgi:hypothetical protein